MDIRVECRAADILPLDAIEEFQGNLKKRGKKEIEQIITSIDKYGFSFPFFVWNGTGHNLCLDGHGRIQALCEMRKRGVSLPLFPVAYIDAKDESEAKQKLLRLNSQYGEMTVESVIEFMGELEINGDELALPGISFGDAIAKEAEGIEYTGKIEIVVSCETEVEAQELYGEMNARGLKCRISTL